jgi:hypothetical protein
VRVGPVMRVCAFAFALTVLAVGCSGGSTETAPAGQPSRAQSSNTPPDGQPSATAETGSTVAAPRSKAFTVYTHCGVESARIRGRWWHAKPPLYGDTEGGGPPAGWGDPYQEGTLTVEAADRAVFEALGQRVVFVPAPDNEPVRVCR